MNCTLIDTHPPGHMVIPSVEPNVCRSNRESQWRTDTQLVIITFDWSVERENYGNVDAQEEFWDQTILSFPSDVSAGSAVPLSDVLCMH